MIIYDDEFCNCSDEQREKFLDKLFSFLDDEFQIDLDPDSHVCVYSPDGICSICGGIKYNSLIYSKLYGTDSKLDYPF